MLFVATIDTYAYNRKDDRQSQSKNASYCSKNKDKESHFLILSNTKLSRRVSGRLERLIRRSLFVMGPHANDLNRLDIIQHLVHKPVLKVDSP